MNFKLDSKWRKVATDGDHTVMEHYEGHQIKIAHKKLGKGMREKLHALPTHKSKAERDSAKVDAPNAPQGHAKATESPQSAPNASMPHAPSKRQENASKGKSVRMADGGEVDSEGGGGIGGALGMVTKLLPLLALADGGEVEKNPSEPAQPQEQQPAPVPPKGTITLGKRIGYPGFVDGGDVDPNNLPPAIPPQGSGIQIQGAAVAPGDIANPEAANSRAVPQPTPEQAAGDLPYGTEAPQQQAAPQAAAPQAPPSSGASPQQQPNDPYGTQAYQEAYMTGLGETKGGLALEAQAAAAQGVESAKLLNDQAVKQQRQMTDYQSHYNSLEQERIAAQKDYAAGHIDPDRWWSNRSTGGKIGSIIGLIAGGLDPSGQGGGAMDMINKQIDRDIHAQQSEMDKKHNVLGMIQQKYGNLKDSTDMMRVMSMDMVSNQLKAAAAKSSGPMARAKLLQAAGQLDMQAAPVLSQMAMRKTLVSGANNGQINPAAVIGMIVPEHERAPAYKELKEAQDSTSFRNNLLAAYDKLHEINTIGNRIGSPIQSSRQIAAIKGPLTAALSKGTAGRFTEQDAELLDSLWPRSGSNDETIATNRNQLVKLADEKMNFPILDRWGINPVAHSSSSRYDAAGNKRIQINPAIRPK